MGQLGINILVTTCLYSLISIGFSIYYRTYRFFNFAIAGYIGIICYAFYYYVNNEYSVFASVLLATLTSLVLIGIVEFWIGKQVKVKQISKIRLLVASIGVFVIIESLINIIFQAEARLVFPNIEDNVVVNGFFIVSFSQSLFVVASIIVIALFSFWVKYTWVGKSLLAVMSNRNLSAVFGVNENVAFVSMFVWSTVFFVLASLFITSEGAITPEVGYSYFLNGIIAFIITGNQRNIVLLLIGSFTLALLQHLTAYFIGYKWLTIVPYLFLVLILVFRPSGIFKDNLKKSEI